MKLTAREMALLATLCKAGEMPTQISATDLQSAAALAKFGLARRVAHLVSWYGPTPEGRALLAEARDGE